MHQDSPQNLWKKLGCGKEHDLFWHCAGESGYIGLFLVARLEGYTGRIMDSGTSCNWLESCLYCLLDLGNSFWTMCVDWIMTHRTPAYPSISSLMICEVFQNRWLAFTPLFVIVVQLLSRVWLCDPMDYSIIRSRASLSFTVSQILLKLMCIVSVMPSNNLILCCPLLL